MRLEKKDWISPRTNYQEFRPQQYCGSCEHSESGVGNYLFECNAGNKGEYAHGVIWLDIVNPDQLDTGNSGWGTNDRRLGGFHPCNVKHEAPTTDDFENGWFVPCKWSEYYGSYDLEYNKAFKVILWRGDGDLHATENLDRETWEKNVS